MFELFEHTADLGLRAEASTLEELLAEAARGLLAMLVANPSEVRLTHSKTLLISYEEPSYLLFDWLSEILFAFESDKLLLAKCEIRLESGQLRATCRGEPMDESRHQMDHEVKAITYHGLVVAQTDNGWRAEVIVDI
jgi:SHS2 domain-containing protein